MTETEKNFELKSFIQPRKLANKNGELRYQWHVEDFSRLDGLLYSNDGRINVHLKGRFDDRNRCLVEAHISADVQLECQTSFEAIGYEIDTKVLYCTLVSEEQIADLDEEYEALLIDDGQVDIKEVIEDELILSIPVIANKAISDLGINMTYGEIAEEKETKKNPFLVLQDLDIKK